LAPIVAVPAAEQFATPATLGAFAIVATVAADELQWLFRLMSCVLPSLKVPVAANCCVLPTAAVGAKGVTARETSVPVPTVSVVVPVTPEADAEMVTVPPFLPWVSPEPRIEAIFGLEDFHETPLRFVAVLPSLNVPVALNLMEVPRAIRGFAGLMLMETRRAVETVSPVDPLIAPKSALIVLLPVATLVSRPWLLMVAAAGFEEVQTTEAVTSCVLLSLNVPVALNCFVVPTAMVEFAGVTAIEIKVAPEIVSDAVPLTDPALAVIVATPVPTLVARPVESTVAMEEDEEDQVNDWSHCVLPSSKFPTAVNCCVVPSAMDGVAGVTEIEMRCAATTVKVVLSVNEPTVAVIVVDPAATVAAKPELLMVATAVDEEFQFTPLTKSALEPSL
jgi:hypothetical protein